ncbi:MAG: tripartite tricarboxylate transporter permease, partial [Sphaerochaetaceae bacterium]
GALIPMLALGVPGSGTTAVMMGALLMLGLQPGPALFQQQSNIVWAIIASMFIGNIILAIVNIPLAGVLVRVLAVPPKVLYPIVLGLTFVGTYAIASSTASFYLLLVFGIFGYFMAKADFPSSPFVLAVIVGTNMEQYFRRAYKISNGSFKIFTSSPICIIFIVLIIGSMLLPVVQTYLKRKKAKVQGTGVR